MKRILIILLIIVVIAVGYFSTQKPKQITEQTAPISTFKWRFEEGALNPDGIPGTQIFLDATYGIGKILSKSIDEVGGSCNEISPSKEDQDMMQGSSKIQCYAAGLGQWFKITKEGNSYKVKRKTFEEASPDYTPPIYEYETITEFPLVY